MSGLISGLSDIVSSPNKHDKKKPDTRWFEFAIDNNKNIYRSVSFSSQQYPMVKQVNGKTNQGLKITNAEFTNNKFKLSCYSTIEQIPLAFSRTVKNVTYLTVDDILHKNNIGDIACRLSVFIF